MFNTTNKKSYIITLSIQIIFVDFVNNFLPD